MAIAPLNLLLADDDLDDCIFFKEALEELAVNAQLKTVKDGVQLMQFLEKEVMPDILFLDLNMPRKTGIECLYEIKKDEKLKLLPVIIYTTSLDKEVVNLLYEKGALYCIKKPAVFAKLKKVILEALTITFTNSLQKTAKENFIIQA